MRKYFIQLVAGPLLNKKISRALAQEAWGPWKVLGGSGDHPASGLLFGAKILLNEKIFYSAGGRPPTE